MEEKEEYWKILNNTNDWIKYSDTKATIILTMFGVLITIIYSNSAEVLAGIQNSNWILFFSILTGICTTLSILFAFLCINPKLTNSNPNSIIYFGHIKKKFKTSEEYSKKASKIMANSDSYRKELAEQVHTNSKIAWGKFKNVTWCVRFLFSSLSFMLVSILIYLFG